MHDVYGQIKKLIKKNNKSNCFLQTPPDSCSTCPQLFSSSITVSFSDNLMLKSSLTSHHLYLLLSFVPFAEYGLISPFLLLTCLMSFCFYSSCVCVCACVSDHITYRTSSLPCRSPNQQVICTVSAPLIHHLPARLTPN